MRAPERTFFFPLGSFRNSSAAVPKTKISRPVELTSYSVDGQGKRRVPGLARKLKPDIALPLDLATHMELLPDGSVPDRLLKPKDHESDSLTRLTDTMAEAGIEPQKFHYVTFRYNLNRIMETPYNKRDQWSMGVRRAPCGTIYLDARVPRDHDSASSRSKYVYWGYKFEDAVTQWPQQAASASEQVGSAVGDHPEGVGDVQPPLHAVDPNQEYCSVVAVNLGHHRLLVGAEIDCYEEYPRSSTPDTSSSSPESRGERVHRAGAPGISQNAATDAKKDLAKPPQLRKKRGRVHPEEEQEKKEEDTAGTTGSSTQRVLSPKGKRVRTEGSGTAGVSRSPASKNDSSSTREQPTRRRYVELKTSRLIESSRQHFTWRRYKLLRFWIQSFLVGVETILVGFRDDEGCVHRLERMQVQQLPKVAQHVWDPFKCLAFTDRLLLFLQHNVKEGKEYLLSYSSPFEQVELSQVEDCHS